MKRGREVLRRPPAAQLEGKVVQAHARATRWVVAMLLLPLSIGWLPGREMIARGQSSSFVPFTGTAEVGYTRLPQYSLPSRAAVYAGEHKFVVHFTVRDRAHFRVDIQTLSPAIASGMLRVVVRGRVISAYDTRTETAGTWKMPDPKRFPPVFRTYFTNYLLPYFMAGQGLGVIGSPPNPSRSVDKYVAMIQHELSKRYPPEYPRSYARIVGQEQMLGRTVDVVEFGPLQASDNITGCSFSHPGRCVHHYQTTGMERLWIDHVHPFILQAKQEGFRDPHDLSVWATDESYRVTEITYGVGPSESDLQLHAPVKVVKTKNWSILAGGERSGSGPLAKGFLNLSPPNGTAQLSVNESVEQLQHGPVRKVTGVDILYSSGRHVTTYLHPGDRYGQGLYVRGAYMYIQERLQVHGLPAVLRAGTPRIAGKCQVWTGTYPQQQHWLALVHGRVSIEIVSNLLSEAELVQYVATTICK